MSAKKAPSSNTRGSGRRKVFKIHCYFVTFKPVKADGFFGRFSKKNLSLALALTASGKNTLGQRGGGVFPRPSATWRMRGLGQRPITNLLKLCDNIAVFLSESFVI